MKRKFSKQLWVTILTLSSLIVVDNTQAASILSGNLNVDNQHTTYISIDNSTAGSQISTSTNWRTTSTFSGISLEQGQDYFLHINATDTRGYGGFLGDFSLSGTDHVFANGATDITTNDINWLVSTSGWSNYFTAIRNRGENGIDPWGVINGISEDATWIWSSDNYFDNDVFFSLEITSVTPSAVPLPAAVWLFGSSLIGLVGMRKKSSKISLI